MKNKLILSLLLACAAHAQEAEPVVDPVQITTTPSVVTVQTDTEWAITFKYGPTYTTAGKTINDYTGCVVTKITITRHIQDGREISRDVVRETRNATTPFKVLYTNVATNTVLTVAGPGKALTRMNDAPSRLFNNSVTPATE